MYGHDIYIDGKALSNVYWVTQCRCADRRPWVDACGTVATPAGLFPVVPFTWNHGIAWCSSQESEVTEPSLCMAKDLAIWKPARCKQESLPASCIVDIAYYMVNGGPSCIFVGCAIYWLMLALGKMAPYFGVLFDCGWPACFLLQYTCPYLLSYRLISTDVCPAFCCWACWHATPRSIYIPRI